MHNRIAEDIRERIAAGELAPGDAVPSESRLCAHWSVSRGPVRQALAALRAEGAVGGGQGKPPVVLRAALSQPFDTFLSFSRWVSGIGRTPGQRTLEVARRPASADVAGMLGLSTGDPVVQVLRLRFIDEQPTMLERTSFVEPVGRLLFGFDCDSGSIYAFLAASGVDMSLARHTIDAVAADESDSELLEVAAGDPLLREWREARGASGDPVEYSEDRYRPDMVSFTISNSQESQPALVRSWKPDGSAAS